MVVVINAHGNWQSHPSRGAWIEIGCLADGAHDAQSRTPRGVRGLKCQRADVPPARHVSHPSRGAWIEIGARECKHTARLSHPSRGAWIEIAG